MYIALYWKIKFVYLFTLVDYEGREIKTPCRNESACLIQTNAGHNCRLYLQQMFLILLAQQNLK